MPSHPRNSSNVLHPRGWRVASLLATFLLLTTAAGAAENLAPDASFESELPLWFTPHPNGSCYAAKEAVAGAPDGRQVLVIQAWDARGTTILSGPITLPAPSGQTAVVSATAAVRGVGATEGVKVELALLDEKGSHKLASLGQVIIDHPNAWRTLRKTGVPLKPGVQTGRLALLVSGTDHGGRVEIDTVGLFAQADIQQVTDNCDLAVVEAEDLADGRAWTVVDHYGGWYRGTPSGMKMLAGFHKAPDGAPLAVSRTVTLRQDGPHRLWVRFHTNPYCNHFTVQLTQAGKTLAQQAFGQVGDQKYSSYEWTWQSLDVDAHRGPLEITISRDASGCSGHGRKIDLLVFTNRLDYQPEVEHFLPAAYLRFVNTSEGVEPFCWWIWVRRHQGPHWYANPGVLSRAGLSGGYHVPADRGKWLAPGGTSPWVRINDYLLAAGGRNNVSMTATRKMHTDGFVEGRIRGRLEFATGPARTIVKTIAVDQDAPRLLLTLPGDVAAHPEQIRTALDYVAETEAEIAKLGPARGKLAQHMDLSTPLGLEAGVDDPEVVRREINILKALGFNETYHLIAPPDKALAFAAEHGLVPRFGAGPSLWGLVEHKSQHHPDTRKMEEAAARFATQNAAILPNLVRAKLMDEPGGMSYRDLVESEPCRAKFQEWLKAQGLSPKTLGVADWDAVVPVLPENRRGHERLFYYTGLFRLEAFATLAKACVAAKQRHLPATMLTYVNYSPPTSGGSWTERGTDLFLAHRNGGMEMIWTEDWLGYSVGPQHLSEVLAIARAAGRPQNCPLGAYWVGDTNATLMRMKFYTLLAGGVRSIAAYSYGPWYAGIDSWGRRFEIYSAIRDCQFELGVIEDSLQGTTRHKSDVAILYNRTSAIWLGDNNVSERSAGFTHWALAHAGYDADFLPEEDIDAGQLAHYKVLYMDGPWLRRSTAQAIANWVRQRGILFATAGAASRDEFDASLETLDDIFGARSEALEIKGDPSRPKYETRGAKSLAKLSRVPGSRVPATALDQLFLSERLSPRAGAETILSTPKGEPAGVVNAAGKGLSVRLAALPALAYVHEALQPPYEIESYLPTAYRAALRDFIAWPAQRAGATRVAASACPIAEIVRYDGPDRAVIFLIDHTAKPNPRFTFQLFDAAGFTKAVAATGAAVELSDKGNGTLELTLPLSTADAVVLTR